MRATLRDVRQSRLPESIGSCVGGNALLLSTVNEAQQRLIMDESQPDEGWWLTYAIMAFNVSRDEPFFVTPRGVARVTMLDICKKPVILRNQFFEYLDFGNGLKPGGCCNRSTCGTMTAYDRGPVVTFKELAPPNKKIRVYFTDITDAGKRILFSGKDGFGNIIYTQDGFSRATGEFLVFTSPFVDSVNEFTELSGIQKDLTNGAIQIFEVDTVTTDERLILTMEPGETTASYRRYYASGLPSTVCGSSTIQVSAVVKLDFIPVVADTDYLIISNLPALKEECQAVRYSEMDDANSKKMAVLHHGNALRLLFGELDLYVGKERVSVTVPIFGSDRLRRQVV